MPRLRWLACGACGGDLPTVDSDNNDPRLPQRLRHGGDCPGYLVDGVCGAYEGWSSQRIERYVQRQGVEV